MSGEREAGAEFLERFQRFQRLTASAVIALRGA